MRKPDRIKRGQVITADFLNSLADQVAKKLGLGGPLGGLMGILGNPQSIPPPQIRLVEAIARAEKHSDSDDEFGNSNQVWSQRCRFVKITNNANGYQQDNDDDAFRVYFPTHYRRLSGGEQTIVDHPPVWHQTSHEGVLAGGRFWAIFSAMTGRWEFLGMPQQVVRFKLTEDLSPGGSALATAMWSQAGTDAPSADSTIKVYEWRNAVSMSTNDLGYAAWCADLGRWEVLTADGGTFDLPSIRLGMATDAQGENIFPGNTVASYTIAWSDSEKLITDTSVFDVTDSPGAGIYESIVCKVAGTYRVWYHLRFNQDTTHTASEIQRGSVDVIHVTGSNVIVPGTASSVETLHIDAIDMAVGLGALNAHAHGESLITVAANELLQVQFSFASGVRGLKATGESFGAQLVKRS